MIAQCRQVLSSDQSGDFEKAFFLRFLIHLVGDIHQPLHSATRVTARLPKGDGGGQLFSLKWSSGIVNLHALWDSGIGLFEREFIRKRYKAKFYLPYASCDDPMSWARESFNIAKNFVYQTPEGEYPNAEYIKKARRAVKKQIALAGFRLACVLNKTMQ